MPIANPSPYPTETPLATLRAHVSLPPSFPSLVLYRLLPPPPPTSLLYSIRPLLAARTRVSGEPPPLNHHARDRHIHRDIAISCVNYRPPSPSFSLLSDPRGHHARVVSSPVIVVCDAANLYYAAHRFTRARADYTRGRKCTSDLYLRNNSAKSASKFSKSIALEYRGFSISHCNGLRAS